MIAAALLVGDLA